MAVSKNKNFTGWLLLIAGIIILINIIFGIAIPLFRIILAVLLIYWGLRFVSNRKGYTFPLFKNKLYTGPFEKDYHIIFGGATFDFRGFKPTDNEALRITSTLANCKIILPQNLPVIIQNNTFLGQSIFPTDKIFIGSYTYRQGIYTQNEHHILIITDVNFSTLDIVTEVDY